MKGSDKASDPMRTTPGSYHKELYLNKEVGQFWRQGPSSFHVVFHKKAHPSDATDCNGNLQHKDKNWCYYSRVPQLLQVGSRSHGLVSFCGRLNRSLKKPVADKGRKHWVNVTG